MQTVYLYKTVPTFFYAIEQRLDKLGNGKLTVHQDPKNRRIGFYDGKDVYCVEVATLRGYYNAVHAKEQAPITEAKMYARDVASIMSGRNKRAN